MNELSYQVKLGVTDLNSKPQPKQFILRSAELGFVRFQPLMDGCPLRFLDLQSITQTP